MEASKPKCVNPDNFNMGLTHLDSKTSKYILLYPLINSIKFRSYEKKIFINIEAQNKIK